jgi:putative ABC transport system permease protein
VPIFTAIVGLILISIDSIILFSDWQPILGGFSAISPAETERSFKFFAHLLLGLPTLMVGFFLLAPMFVWVVERVLGPLVAAMLGLKFALLRQQLSSGIWRAAGTCAALMVGLAILTVQQTQGHTMLNGWKLPDKFPDIFIWSPARELTRDEQAKLASVEGIRPGEVMPIAILSPEFGSSLFALAGAAIMPDATMFFGVDPDKAFKMMELDFREGTPEEAERMLKLGRHIIVTDEFRQLKNLHVGDKVPLVTKNGKVDYTIAGVVWSPGIDVIVSVFDMGRQFDQRTAASVFGTLEDARNDFGVEGVRLFAANLDYFVEKEPLLEKVKLGLGEYGLKAGDVRQIKYAIQQGFHQLLLLVSTVAFAAMAVASLGVTNTIMASIRSRRWQFGVLRSIGVTASQLVRLVIAEAVLLGLVGCGLGLAAGLLMSFNAQRINIIVMGYGPPMTIPWGMIDVGVIVVMGISVLASLWPALIVAKTEPLELLQAGRASS